MQFGEFIESYKQSLMSDSSGISEGQNANRNVNSKDCAHENSERIENTIGKWSRGYLHYMMGKNLSTFFP